jgi:predicted aspartyl protease
LEAVDPYIIIFAVLAVVTCLCLYSVLGLRTGSERPFRVSALTRRLSAIAAVLCAVLYVANAAQWHSMLEASLAPIAVPTASAPGAEDSVPIYPTNHGTSAMIDVQLGGQPLRMLLDTGATTCLISEAIAAGIVRDGYGDWQGTDRFKMADGTIRTLPTLLIREARIGRHTVRTVRAGVVSSTGEMLLAFPVVNAIAPFTIDTRARVLIFHTSSNGGGHIAASTTAVPTITARVLDGNTVVVGISLAMALLLGAALVLSFLHWKEWKAQKLGQGVCLKKAKPLGGLLLTPLNKLRNRFRRKLTPGEIQRREQRSRTRL